MELREIVEYIDPAILVLVPVLYCIGAVLKTMKSFADKHIPLVLGLCGAFFASLWVFGTSDISGVQNMFKATFTAIAQGILCAGCSVYVNQIWKQEKNAQDE